MGIKKIMILNLGIIFLGLVGADTQTRTESKISQHSTGGRSGDGTHSQVSSHSHSSSSHSSSTDHSDGIGHKSPSVSSSQTDVTVDQKCTNDACVTCINDKCFNSVSYTSVNGEGSCPITVCTEKCNQYVVASDGCPICRCKDGTGIREPCNSASDCPKNATGCKENACSYSNVPADAPLSCSYAHQCPASEDCIKGKCTPTTEGKHVEGQTCIFDYECPSKYACRGSTCWDGAEVHLTKRSCAFLFNCPSGYECRQQTCYKGGPEHSEHSCVLPGDCEDGWYCTGMTCVRS